MKIPDLDDRRFQDLVDDAKRMVQERAPAWTDHNVSDPGVTLIETVAFMVDELFYRLNRVPDRLYVTFLDLIGVQLHPPAAAVAELVFRLAAPQQVVVTIPEGSEVGTRRVPESPPIVFATTADLAMPPRELVATGTAPPGAGAPVVGAAGGRFAAFSETPQVGDAMLLGLDGAAPDCAVRFRFGCEVRGVGVDPRQPPIRWEGWSGTAWEACEVVEDGTGGLNRTGDVVVILPGTHTASLLAGVRAGWVRCRTIAPPSGFPFYSESPVITSVTAATIGGRVAALHAERIADEVVGLSEGVPGQRFALQRSPVVADRDPVVVEVADGAGWTEWTEVSDFAGAGPDDRVVTLDRAEGLLVFGPALRQRDGSLRHFGAVPPKGVPLRVRSYRTGGGAEGNVAAGTLTVLRRTIPFVAAVENRLPAHGGTAGETVDEAKRRAPVALRTRDRAVTVEDFESIAVDAAPGIARVRCAPASNSADAGLVRLLVVPTPIRDQQGRIPFESLDPPSELLAAIAERLDQRRLVGTRVLVEPPRFQGVTVITKLDARGGVDPEELSNRAADALYRYLDPVDGGPEGRGWPFGRPLVAGELFGVLQRLPGVELVEEVLLFPADPVTGKRGEQTGRIELAANALVFPFEHRVRVAAGG